MKETWKIFYAKKCNNCNHVFKSEFKLEVIKKYLNSMGARAIARVKGMHNSVVSYWVKKAGLVMKEDFYCC